MGNVAVVQVEDGTDKLAEEVRGFFFRKSVALDNVIEKVAFFAVLHHDVLVRFVFENLVKLDHVPRTSCRMRI